MSAAIKPSLILVEGYMENRKQVKIDIKYERSLQTKSVCLTDGCRQWFAQYEIVIEMAKNLIFITRGCKAELDVRRSGFDTH